MRVIFFTKYTDKGPSSRYRTFQFSRYFENFFNCKYYSFFDDDYISLINNNHKIKLSKYILFTFKRIYIIFFKVRKSDIIFIEYELIPYFPPFLEYFLYLKGVKFVLDFDDAIFHNYDNHSNFLAKQFFKNKIPVIAKISSYIISGSPYLTEYLKKYNCNISEIPTSIDFDIYQSKIKTKNFIPNEIVIGWIGSKTTSYNLLKLRDVFISLIEKFPNLQFHFCGFDNSLISEFSFNNSYFFNWSPEIEYDFLNSIDIGIMPLEDNLFNKGKCGFKLIQYMAVGKPTISFPFESNIKINHGNENKFASNTLEWSIVLTDMILNIEYYRSVGIKNIEIIKNEYSIQSNFSKYISIFNSL